MDLIHTKYSKVIYIRGRTKGVHKNVRQGYNKIGKSESFESYVTMIFFFYNILSYIASLLRFKKNISKVVNI